MVDSTTPPRRPGRPLVALGLGLTALGIAAYVGQVSAGHLKLPWYLPATGTLGAACVAAALWRARTVLRGVALALLVLVAAAEWGFVLGTRLAPYAGTAVAEGRPFPPFSTARADGTPFTRADLEGDRDTVMIFFRGRW